MTSKSNGPDRIGERRWPRSRSGGPEPASDPLLRYGLPAAIG